MRRVLLEQATCQSGAWCDLLAEAMSLHSLAVVLARGAAEVPQVHHSGAIRMDKTGYLFGLVRGTPRSANLDQERLSCRFGGEGCT